MGTLIPHFKKGDFEHLSVPVPNPPAQRAIGDSYFELSSKVESNRRLVELIPKLIAAEVAAAIDHEAEVRSIASLARFVNGGAYTKDATGTGRMVLRIAELNSGPGASTVYNDITVDEDRIARPGDILMSWSGSLGVYRWARDEAIVNQHIFKVIPDSLPSWLVHDRLNHVMPLFRSIAKDKATTMGHIQRGHLEKTDVRIPIAATRLELDRRLGLLWNRLLLAEREIVQLSALRDCLLVEAFSERSTATSEHEISGLAL